MQLERRSKNKETSNNSTSQIPRAKFAREDLDPDTIRFLFLTDNHLGYDEKDPVISHVSTELISLIF
jgi:hypothetical protein